MPFTFKIKDNIIKVILPFTGKIKESFRKAIVPFTVKIKDMTHIYVESVRKDMTHIHVESVRKAQKRWGNNPPKIVRVNVHFLKCKKVYVHDDCLTEVTSKAC